MADAPRYVLGINAYDHDVSACLLRDGEVVAAIEKERLTRVKHDSGFFDEAVAYVLLEAGIGLEQVAWVVSNCYVLPVPELERRLLSIHQPYHLPRSERERALSSRLFLPGDSRFRVCSHHLAHAYSAFAVSPFEEGAVMVVDGIGSYRRDVIEPLPEADPGHPLAREAESYYRFSQHGIEAVKKIWMGPHKGIVNDDFYTMPGLGALYSRVSNYIFGHWNACGEVMGLAPYGRPGLEPLVKLVDGALVFRDWDVTLRRPFLGGSDAAWERSPQRSEWEDLARRVQEDVETILLERARRLHAATGEKNLVLAGGVALNCVANGRLLRESPFERIFVQPAAGDGGIALGCALYGHLALDGGRRSFVMQSAALGRPYSADEIELALSRPAVRLAAARVRGRDPVEAAADLLARGRVVGWFMGRGEFGPRALGNRSILADPRDPETKGRVNAEIKHRQGFRPFAPVVPLEDAPDYFEGAVESPFMTLALRVRPEKRGAIPAVVHVDGTARVQTVRKEDDPTLHALLKAFERRTGVPILLNTSFNLRGEPLVESPRDAVEAFLSTELDALVLHDRIVRKRAAARTVLPFLRFVVGLRRRLRAEALLESAAADVLTPD